MSLLPKPQLQSYTGGYCRLSEKVTVSFDSTFTDLPQAFAEKFAMTKLQIETVKSEAFISFELNKSLGAEAYTIDITPTGIRLIGGDEAGAFYALMTLVQLGKIRFRPHGDVDLECQHIEDKPMYTYRGIMIDEARHFFGMDIIKQTLNEMAYHKLNVLHWHLTEDQGWRVEIKKHPRLAEEGSIRKNEQLENDCTMANVEYGKGCFYTQDQLREIVEYARARHIMVIPEVDMPGHLTSAISIYPELSCCGEPREVRYKWGIEDIVGCVGNPALFKFASEVIDELSEIFPAPYFHIGGDEVPRGEWRKCPKCQALMKEKGMTDECELQEYFNNQVAEYLATKGKTLMGWNELLDSKKLTKDIVVQWWRDRTLPLKWLSEGGKTVLSHSSHVYIDYTYVATNLQKVYEFGAEALNLNETQKKAVWGLEAPLWTEYIRDKAKYDFNLYPRLQALAEAAWTADGNKDYQDFTVRLQQFMQEMEIEGINRCDATRYNPVGWKGRKQRRYVKIHNHKDCYCELKFEKKQWTLP